MASARNTFVLRPVYLREIGTLMIYSRRHSAVHKPITGSQMDQGKRHAKDLEGLAQKAALLGGRSIAAAFLCFGLGLPGCTAMSGGRVTGDANTATVQAASAIDALPLAVVHCSSFHKAAEYDREQGKGRYRYRCV
jgi:hypothetical protein